MSRDKGVAGHIKLPNVVRRLSKKVGMPPGSVVYVGEQKVDRVRVSLIDYDADKLEERTIEDLGELADLLDSGTVTWINVEGLHEVEVIERFGDLFGVHPLVLEDVVNTKQRPKTEDFDDYLFIATKMQYPGEGEFGFEREQVSLVLGPHWLITFQEKPGDVFELVRERLRKGKGRIRKLGPDYLAYAILDAIVDGYFVVLEDVGERIEALEDELVSQPDEEMLEAIQHLKREMLLMRRSLWPMRDAVSQLERAESDLIDEGTSIFIRDLYDHTLQVLDSIDTYREMISGLLDIYLSSLSNKMNDVMKVLTIIATIFIPLTFVAGIYGMNFAHMPELGWRYGYLGVWVVIMALGVSMAFFFRRKGWL